MNNFANKINEHFFDAKPVRGLSFIWERDRGVFEDVPLLPVSNQGYPRIY